MRGRDSEGMRIVYRNSTVDDAAPQRAVRAGLQTKDRRLIRRDIGMVRRVVTIVVDCGQLGASRGNAAPRLPGDTTGARYTARRRLSMGFHPARFPSIGGTLLP